MTHAHICDECKTVAPLAEGDERIPNLVKVGVYCLRGGGHWACYDEDDAMACGNKGPDVYVDVDFEDYAYYPPWLQRVVDDEFPRGNQS